jgi:CHAT domain-containing protein
MIPTQPRRRALSAGAAVFLATVTAAVAVLHRNHSTEINVATRTAWRPITGRLTGYAYAPLATGHAATSAEAAVWRGAAATAAENVRADPHSAALASLRAGNAADGLKALESLVVRHRNNAGYWSDLAAARLAIGVEQSDAHASALALSAADRSLRLQPEKVEALFNRALALDALGLRFASVVAWRRYLEVDDASGWTVEARERLGRAEAPTRDQLWKSTLRDFERVLDAGDDEGVERIARAFPEYVRRWGEGVYIPDWGEAVVRGDEGATRKALSRARRAGAALRKVNGETLLALSVAAIDADGSKEHAAACTAYRQARIAYGARRIAESLPDFERAQSRLASANNPMALVAAAYRAHALLDLRQHDRAAIIMRELDTHAALAASIRAHALWLHTRAAVDAARPFEALRTAGEARQAFERLGEIEPVVRLRSIEAAMLALLGRDHDAWNARWEALAGAAEAGKWSLVATSLEPIAWDAISANEEEIASSLLQVQLAAPSVLPLTRFHALLWHAYIDRRAGNRAAIERVRPFATQIPDAVQRADAADELNLAEALALQESDPAAAERLLSSVIDYRTSNDHPADLAAVHVHRARARRAAGQLEAAEDDLRRAIALFESRGDGMGNERARDGFLAKASDAYTGLAALLLEQGEWQEAFETAERVRGRLFAEQAHQRPTLGSATSAIPPHVIGVHFTTFDAATLIVVLERGRARHHVVPVGRAEIESLRDRLADAMQRSDDAAEVAHARRLYELLVTPFARDLSPGRLLVLIPDDATYGIPFAALRNGAGTFLLEETQVALAPTAAALGNRHEAIDIASAQFTVLADPAFRPALFPSLHRLAAARRDAAAVSKLFLRTTVFGDVAATRTALQREAANSDVIHIAAHAFSSARDASLSLIALAESVDDDGILYRDDIQSLTLRRRPLVVLAACETGSLGGGRGSMRSLAHAFLEAGSRSVLATLWNVGDDESSALMTSFYRSLKSGASPPAALRDAQLRAMRYIPTRDWAAFQLHGGVPQEQEGEH